MSDLSIVEVTQADREAAAELNWLTDPKYAFNLKHGMGDRNQLVQAFARHRASEAERVREACAKVAEGVAQIIGAAPGSSIYSALFEAGAAIRSLPISGE